jgi:sulfite reductase alpha subunit-like flavoprotein
MVGPGTGVAPFRGFMQLRQRLSDAGAADPLAMGKTMLFFGCRHKDKDFIFR